MHRKVIQLALANLLTLKVHNFQREGLGLGDASLTIFILEEHQGNELLFRIHVVSERETKMQPQVLWIWRDFDQVSQWHSGLQRMDSRGWTPAGIPFCPDKPKQCILNGMPPSFKIFYGWVSQVLHLSHRDQTVTSCLLILPLRSPISSIKLLRLKGSQLQLLRWMVIKIFWTGVAVGVGKAPTTS